MKNIAQEIHRRSLWQVLGIYLAGAWIALQVVNEIADAVGLPDWVSAGALVLLVVGLPIVIATAFIHQGLRTRTHEVPEQSLAEVGEVAPPPPVEISGAGRILTWRRALVGGAGAFVLFALGTGGWMGLRTLGIGAAGSLVAKGALEERGSVLISEFDAADEELRSAATQALTVDLSQSNVIRLMQPRAVEAALERMGREATDAVTAEVAREIAEREGLGAIVTGEINQAGAGYVFTASVLSGADGSVLTTQRESASDGTDVIPAIDRLSRKLRERIGESFGSIRSSPPLDRVTTPSLEALKLYSVPAGGDRRIALLEEAIELDPDFAMAWRSLGIVYRNRSTEPAKTVEAMTRAYELRDRLTDRERRLMSADYYNLVEFDPARAIPEYRALLEMDPEDLAATINLGVVLSELRDHEGSARQAQRAIELADGGRNTGYWNSVVSLVNLGDLDAAQAIIDSSDARFGPNSMDYPATMVSQARGDIAGTEATLMGFVEQGAGGGFRRRIAGDLAALQGAQGRVASAVSELELSLEVRAGAGDAPEYLEDAVQGAWLDVAVRGKPDEGLARLEAALERFPLADLSPLDRPYPLLAEVFARCGAPDRSTALLDEMEREIDMALLGSMRSDIDRARAEIALAEGRAEDAVALFQRSDVGFCFICALPGLAIAYEGVGQPDSARVVLERYAETPYSDRFMAYTYPQGPTIGPAYERLAQLSDEAGDLDAATRFYARFVELWAEADDELQPRVQAAQARLEEILREVG